MNREIEMVIKIPIETVKDTRLFVVLYGGEIISERNENEIQEKN